jgi:hypothetical protein
MYLTSPRGITSNVASKIWFIYDLSNEIYLSQPALHVVATQVTRTSHKSHLTDTTKIQFPQKLLFQLKYMQFTAWLCLTRQTRMSCRFVNRYIISRWPAVLTKLTAETH